MGVILAILIFIEVVTTNIAMRFDMPIEDRITLVNISVSIVSIALGILAIFFIE